MRTMQFRKNCRRSFNECGATAVEYALIISLIVLVLAAAVTIFGGMLQSELVKLADEIAAI